jgi:hypothetical protein
VSNRDCCALVVKSNAPDTVGHIIDPCFFIACILRNVRPKNVYVKVTFTWTPSKHTVIRSPLAKPHITVFGKVGCQTREFSGDASRYFLTGFQVMVEKIRR